MAEPKQKPKQATYRDVLEAPDTMVAEVVEGDLYLTPRPSKPHTFALSALGAELQGPFGRGKGGPGGWIILDEPELHLGAEIIVPDLAGWRRDRAPMAGDEPFFTVVPDWVCEIVSPRTGRLDRVKKLPLYAVKQVPHAWIIDPVLRTLEVFRNEGGRWSLIGTHAGKEEVRAEPFAAVPLELAALWPDPEGDERD
jgi:Uma2 family endonuclease